MGINEIITSSGISIDRYTLYTCNGKLKHTYKKIT